MENLSEQDRMSLAYGLMQLFDRWKIKENADRLSLLGIENARSRWVNAYRKGTKALPQTETVLKRVQYLLDIHEALKTTFPHSQAVMGVWIHTKNRKFNNNSPLQVMLAGGTDGIYQVLCELDCTQNWI